MSVKSAEELSEASNHFSECSHRNQLGGNYPFAICSERLDSAAKINQELISSASRLASVIPNYDIISPNSILIPLAVCTALIIDESVKLETSILKPLRKRQNRTLSITTTVTDYVPQLETMTKRTG